MAIPKDIPEFRPSTHAFAPGLKLGRFLRTRMVYLILRMYYDPIVSYSLENCVEESTVRDSQFHNLDRHLFISFQAN